ncbi:BrnT family toxin [Amaricoccus sp. B4]|uniref:BrnT family toxin n=1 Tax=Amaricoccus sp. B4 TaxID=3368557 RepID=UPI00371B97AA
MARRAAGINHSPFKIHTFIALTNKRVYEYCMTSAAKYIWDEAKRAANFANHGFDWTGAAIVEDTRHDYGERRQIALGVIGDRLHVCVFTDRGTSRRIISLRKANRREVRAFNGD